MNEDTCCWLRCREPSQMRFGTAALPLCGRHEDEMYQIGSDNPMIKTWGEVLAAMERHMKPKFRRIVHQMAQEASQ